MIAMNDIQYLTRISLEKAMKIFMVKIVPIITYGLEIVWQYLTKSNLKDLEKVKATYLKRVLGLSRFAPSRIVYELTREPMLLDLKRVLGLSRFAPSRIVYELTREPMLLDLKRVLGLSRFAPSRIVYVLTREPMLLDLKRVLGLSRFAPSRIVYELTREPMLLDLKRVLGLSRFAPSRIVYELTREPMLLDLKRVFGLSRFAPSRIVYELTREPMLLEDLWLQFLLPSTSAYEGTVLEHRRKKAEIWEEFYVMDAMAREDWNQANYLQRHLVTRFATHGFHFKICRNTSFHDPNEEWMCLLCDELCGRYHVMECKN
ncbi:hypothetical protein ANN_09054 [Periplaneta americana]|uniref:Uncharacterized protein n=1 Tax=Periplaneta americana TaxID=6978 RepID=A0ABQ8TMP8_PERAM|nr:hypothetical protein ANN_09054 [Periplaneta americana]